MEKIKDQQIKVKYQNEEIIIPNKIFAHQDEKTGANSVSFPFTFPDGVKGVNVVIRLKKEKWNPSDYIKSVIINFNQ